MDKERIDTIDFLQQSNFIEGEMSSEALDDAIEAWEFSLRKEQMDIITICEIHRTLMNRLNPRIAGKLRTCDVMVGGRVCPSYKCVPTMLHNWVKHYSSAKTEEEIKKAHIEFEYIHPFEDGNGRTGRIILNWQRIKNGLPILIIREEERFEYYTWFK